MLLKEEREAVVAYGRRLVTHRLTRGTGGNVSVFCRAKGLFAISPSGMDYFETESADVVVMDLEGRVAEGSRRPSSESDMHRLLYREREDVGAVVHTHSPYATVLACLHRELPPVHYLIGFAGRSVRCTPYAPFGTPELARLACDGMRDRYAVLLGNHGLLAAGPTPAYAFDTAEEIEFVCEVYCRSLAVGTPVPLSDRDMDVALEKFKTYGQRG
ncbi:MAG: L-fuculose-phosphate aldolase [Fretibacterium sp.]|nr:L-fuculose-phosphate aldolase [Fretibacterium sp.]